MQTSWKPSPFFVRLPTFPIVHSHWRPDLPPSSLHQSSQTRTLLVCGADRPLPTEWHTPLHSRIQLGIAPLRYNPLSRLEAWASALSSYQACTLLDQSMPPPSVFENVSIYSSLFGAWVLVELRRRNSGNVSALLPVEVLSSCYLCRHKWLSRSRRAKRYSGRIVNFHSFWKAVCGLHCPTW